MSTTDTGGPPETSETIWERAHESTEFRELRSRLRRFVFPMTAVFLLWYLLYVLLADYAHGFMSTKVFGNVNVGLIFGLLQFVSTFAIAIWYARFAARRMDPIADRLRAEYDEEIKR